MLLVAQPAGWDYALCEQPQREAARRTGRRRALPCNGALMVGFAGMN